MTTSKFGTWTFVALLATSLVMVVHLLWDYLAPVVMSLVIVSIFHNLYHKSIRFLGNREKLAAFLSTLLVFLGVLGPLTMFFMSLIQEVLSIYQSTQTLKETGGIARWAESLKDYLRVGTDYLSGFGIHISTDNIIKYIMGLSQKFADGIYGAVGVVASNLVSISFNFILMLVLIYVFFVKGHTIKNFIMGLVPIPNDEKQRLINRFRELASAVFLGTGLISVLEGIIGGVLFYIFDVPGAIIWACFIMITAFLPVLGASIIVIPAAIYLFLIKGGWTALLFFILNVIHISVLETIVKTYLIGNKSQMHGVLVFLSVISGVQLYGVLGLFYGPLLVTIFLSLAQIYKEHYRNILLEK